MMKFKCMKLLAVAAAAASLSSLASAAGPRRTPVDSTGIQSGVTATLTFPTIPDWGPAVDAIGARGVPGAPGADGTLPAGYREVTITTGPHTGLQENIPQDYPTYAAGFGVGIPSPATVCGADTTVRHVIATWVSYVDGGCSGQGDNVQCNPSSTYYPSGPYTCEPVGTVTQLVKITGSATVSRHFVATEIDPIAAPYNAFGVATSAAAPFCTAKGYLGVTPGTVTGDYQQGHCNWNQNIVQWRNNAWFLNNWCYDTRMTGVTCFK